MNCIFCKIIAGEIPAQKVYENENILAFLDINPKQLGHTVVIPKKHATDLLELTNDQTNMMADIAIVANKLMHSLDADGINMVNNCKAIAGQEIFHVHFHLIPKYEDETRNEEKLNFEEIIKDINEKR